MPESSDTPNEQFLKPTEPTDFGKHIIDKARSGPDAGQPTMSSHEIAELCEKDHKVVIRDIRSMLISLYGDEHVERIIPEHYRNRHSEFIRENAGQLLNAIAGVAPIGSMTTVGDFVGNETLAVMSPASISTKSTRSRLSRDTM